MCAACGPPSRGRERPRYKEQHDCLSAAGWRRVESSAGGYWLCPACAATPEESTVIVALREPHG